MGCITAVGYVPSDPKLMNARWQRLIILDPRTCLHTLFLVCIIACQSPFHLTQNKGLVVPQFILERPHDHCRQNTLKIQHSTQKMQGPRISFITHHKRFRLIPNTVLAQISLFQYGISRVTTPILPEPESPISNGQCFPFSPTSPPAAVSHS